MHSLHFEGNIILRMRLIKLLYNEQLFEFIGASIAYCILRSFWFILNIVSTFTVLIFIPPYVVVFFLFRSKLPAWVRILDKTSIFCPPTGVPVKVIMSPIVCCFTNGHPFSDPPPLSDKYCNIAAPLKRTFSANTLVFSLIYHVYLYN